MSAAKHTAGPWQVAGPSAKGYLVVQGAKGNGVALILMDSDDEEADARLIAAAPDLLAALQEVRSDGPLLRAGLGATIDAAIAKATGEGA